eukprot:CAMPEP_0115322526 /NCGR_PEP_ID=MMETSP0270-20121206/81449_1 /TAXON_ID=71861 /ORGANISM="Scrippsiella trochoidea, Strain CCMP3099" /LENGTH=673 /DNA_ID=CAMNT_0002742497 /DNA_START=165 /DNA_END=2183 /DNA_ORIENTATION=-
MSDRKEPTLDEGHHCDPAGAVFAENLDDLNDIDKQLMLFSSGSNLIAVRWLLTLGANRFACDSNGTTCLHAACRSGSLAIVEEYIRLDENSKPGQRALTGIDIAGWTPLHTAVFMGRHDIVARLLQAGAPADRKNLSGQAVIDLCSDARTRDLIASALQGASQFAPSPGEGERNYTDSMGALIVEQVMPGGRLTASREVRFEPFFVPRNPVIKDMLRNPAGRRQFSAIGRAIFDRQPGRGLAFLVASGCVRDYPIDLVGFLQGSSVDLGQIGVFLGEDFSLSKILRMEFINAVGFVNCGIVACLKKTFASFRAPPDLQKVERILGSLAEVWWRQHHRFGMSAAFPDLASEEEALRQAAEAFAQSPFEDNADSNAPIDRELEGLELRRFVRSSAVLHQLLFSAMMLHWNAHAPLPRSQRISLQTWLDLNRGPDGSNEDLPDNLLVPIYQLLTSSEIPHLWLGGPKHDVAVPPVSDVSALAQFARVEGWVRIVGDGMPVLLGSTTGNSTAPTADCLHMSSMLSEATASSRRRHPDRCQNTSRQYEVGGGEFFKGRDRQFNDVARGRDAVWLSLCSPLLFLSAGPGSTRTPFAFVNLDGAKLAGIEPAKAMFSINGRSNCGDDEGVASTAATLQLVLLLPDGRWQHYELPRLVVEVCDRTKLEGWVLCLNEICDAT